MLRKKKKKHIRDFSSWLAAASCDTQCLNTYNIYTGQDHLQLCELTPPIFFFLFPTHRLPLLWVPDCSLLSSTHLTSLMPRHSPALSERRGDQSPRGEKSKAFRARWASSKMFDLLDMFAEGFPNEGALRCIWGSFQISASNEEGATSFREVDEMQKINFKKSIEANSGGKTAVEDSWWNYKIPTIVCIECLTAEYVSVFFEIFPQWLKQRDIKKFLQIISSACIILRGNKWLL